MTGAAAAGSILCGTLLGLAVLAVLWGRRVRRRQWERTQTWAQQHGWAAIPRPPVDWWRRLPGANPRGITHMLSGAIRERPVHVAAYEVTDVSFDAQGGTTSNTNHYTVVVTSLSRPLPEIVVEPRRGLARLKNRVAGPGNAGSGDPAFDRDFRIRTSAPHAVAHWCTPEVRAAHASGHVLLPWSVQGRELLHYTRGAMELTSVISYASSLVWLAEVIDSGGARER
jgi:MYXO-CTERM domain-containing protein